MKFVVFIAETYVQLVVTDLSAILLALSVCSRLRLATDCCSALLRYCLSSLYSNSNYQLHCTAARTVLYDAFYSYLCRRYWNGILGPSSPPLPGESFDTCSKAVAFTLADTLVNPALLSVGKLGSTENGGETNVLHAWL